VRVIDFRKEGGLDIHVVAESEDAPCSYEIRVLQPTGEQKGRVCQVWLRTYSDGIAHASPADISTSLLPFILEAMNEKETPYEGPFEAGPWLDVAALKAEVREAFGQGVEFGSYSSEARTTLPSNTFVTWTREDPTWTREGYEEVCRRRAISQLSQSEIRFRLELGARFDQNLVTRVILEVMAERASG
jgi:hypothetical protein